MSNETNGKFCQSCAMPMDEEFYGENADGSLNEDYCVYCYHEGKFTENVTMEEMIEICIPHMVENGMGEEEARAIMEEHLPKMKRWKD